MQEIQFKTDLSQVIDFNALLEKQVEIKGMVQNLRVLAWGAFLILRTPRYTIQTIMDGKQINLAPDKIRIESTVKITGTVKNANIKDLALNPRNFEIHVSHIEIISEPGEEALPVDTTKKELNVHLDKKFDCRPLTLRHPRERAVFKIAAVICNEFCRYLTSIDFTRINSPKLVASGAEGGANIFKLEYFGKEAYLAQSPQFYKQMMVGVFGRVFETAPVFRAEKHDTTRHLNEYISLDFEMGFIDSFYDLIRVESALLKSILQRITEECAHEVSLLEMEIPQLNKIVTVKFEEVHEIVYKTSGKDFRGENDLAPEEEKSISEYAKREWDTDFLFVTHYPSAKRPFYTMDDPEDPGHTCSFDLIFRNIEITTGGQRLHRYEDYIRKMQGLNMTIPLFASYLQTFKYGMPPHGGLALGLERLTAHLCGLKNVKEASLFPRDLNRLEP